MVAGFVREIRPASHKNHRSEARREIRVPLIFCDLGKRVQVSGQWRLASGRARFDAPESLHSGDFCDCEERFRLDAMEKMRFQRVRAKRLRLFARVLYFRLKN